MYSTRNSKNEFRRYVKINPIFWQFIKIDVEQLKNTRAFAIKISPFYSMKINCVIVLLKLW